MTKIFLYCFLFLLPLRNIVEKIPNLFGVAGLGPTHILFFLAFIAAYLQKADEQPLYCKPKLSIPIILFIIYLLFEALVTDPSITAFDIRIKAWKDFVLLMSVYFIVFRAFRDKKEIQVALVMMCLANIYMDIYFYRWVRWINFDNFADKLKDINGTFGSVGGSNEWAAFFSIYTPVLFAVLPALRKKSVKLLAAGLAVSNILVLLFTFSRGAYVAIVASLLWYIFLMRKFLWIIVVVILFVGYSFWLPQSVVERIEMTSQVSETGGIQDQDVQSRMLMWDYSLDLIKQSPFTGHGLLSFRYGQWNNPHNQHLYILTELGLVGYSLFLWLILVCYRKARKLNAIASDDFVKRFALGIQLSVVALFVANFFGSRWSYLPLLAYFWSTIALCDRYLILEQDGKYGEKIQL